MEPQDSNIGEEVGVVLLGNAGAEPTAVMVELFRALVAVHAVVVALHPDPAVTNETDVEWEVLVIV